MNDHSTLTSDELDASDAVFRQTPTHHRKTTAHIGLLATKSSGQQGRRQGLYEAYIRGERKRT